MYTFSLWIKTINHKIFTDLEENYSRRNSRTEVNSENGMEKQSVVMFSLNTNNTDTIIEVPEDEDSLELLDLENKGGPRKVSGTSSARGGSGSSHGRRGSIFSVFSNFHMNHRPSCFSRLSEISPSFSMVSVSGLNCRRLLTGIMTVVIISIIFMYFFFIFVPNSFFSKLTNKGNLNYL